MIRERESSADGGGSTVRFLAELFQGSADDLQGGVVGLDGAGEDALGTFVQLSGVGSVASFAAEQGKVVEGGGEVGVAEFKQDGGEGCLVGSHGQVVVAQGLLADW